MSQVVSLPKLIVVKDFADKLEKPVSEVIKVLLDNGFLANINETLDFETASLIAMELGFEVKKEKLDEKKVDILTPNQLAEILSEEAKKGDNLKKRAPIVTILGHVDHGKTTLLDTIRKSNTVESESGGITQHITAYQVEVDVKEKSKVKGDKRKITFVDTPGHEAFSKMRERGSGIADLAILIVAADDGVKPQTKEVIENLQKGKVPFLVAINKIDKPGANPEMVKNQLAEAGVLLEQRGGDIPFVEISAKNKINIEDLLDTILLLADILDIKTNYERNALGIILESHLDQRMGAVATAIIKTGTLNQGDTVIADNVTGTVRRMENFNGKKKIKSLAGEPVTIVGLDKVCKAGAVLQVEENKVTARQKAKRLSLDKEAAFLSKADVKKINEEDKQELPKLNIILCSDVEGSIEAIEQILQTIPNDQVELNILNKKVGNITESDLQLAQTSNAIIYGFKVNFPEILRQTAEKNKVKVKIFEVIYDLTNDVKKEMTELLEPEIIREDIGTLEVLAIFRTEKNKMIIGGKITEGKVLKNAFLEIYRSKELLGQGKVESLKHNQDEVEEVKAGTECGITYAPQRKMVKIEEKDILKFYIEREEKRKID
jgi:translation initiation factor IF-2